MKQWPKVFTLSGDDMTQKYMGLLVTALGVLGACISVYGNLHAPAQIYYVIGSTMLLYTAVYYRLFYFVVLETILLAGHGAVYFGIGTILQIAIPFLLAFQVIVFYIMSGGIKKLWMLVGVSGVAILSSGFAVHDYRIFFVGSTAIACYAFLTSKQQHQALIWAFLNTFFAASSLYKILF